MGAQIRLFGHYFFINLLCLCKTELKVATPQHVRWIICLTEVEPLCRLNSGIQASMIGWNVWGLNTKVVQKP